MAKLSSVHGRRLRSVAAAALIIGATGAFTSGYAHASGVTPAPITGTIAVTVGDLNNNTTSGGTLAGDSLVVTVDGSNVTLNGSTPSGSALGGTSPAFTAVSYPSLPIIGSALSGDLKFQSPLFSGKATCDYTQVSSVQLTLNDSAGDDTLAVVCNTDKGQLELKLIVSANGTTTTPSATPELGSGELLATGLVPALGIVLYRRRRQRRAGK